MSSLTEALKRIEAYSKCDQSYWRPQLSIRDIDVILQDYPFKLPEEVYELYRWHNGTLPIFREDDTTSEIAFDFGYHLAELIGDITFLPLEEAIFWWQARDDYHASFVPYEPSNIFPLFFCDFGKIVVLGSTTQQKFSPVYRVTDLDVSQIHEPLYPSITNMMLAIAEIIESRAKFWDSGICNLLIYDMGCRPIDQKYGRGKSQ